MWMKKKNYESLLSKFELLVCLYATQLDIYKYTEIIKHKKHQLRFSKINSSNFKGSFVGWKNSIT